MNTNNPIVRAAGFVLMCPIDDEPHVLLMRHPKRWDFPKGHCDGNETFLETAIRELEEETGISPETVEIDPDFQFDLNYEVTYKRHGKQKFAKQVRYFLGQLTTQPTIIVTEHDGFEWRRWEPPMQIQTETIDVTLSAVAQHLDSQ